MIDFERVKNLVSLREVAERYTTLNKHGQGPCPICADGVDRFYIVNSGDRFGCRQCGAKGDAIELVRRMEKISPAEAARRLGAADSPLMKHDRGRQAASPKPKAPEPFRAWSSPEWQSRARALVEMAENLMVGSDGEAYVIGRGIDLDTCKRYRVGFVPRYMGRPAVLIPWLDRVGVISAIKYRFIDKVAAQDQRRRFSQVKGSCPILFGVNALRGSDTLIVVEGEINALALARSVPYDVVSFGHEGNSKGVEQAGVLFKAGGYRRWMFWFDKMGKAEEIHEMFPGAASMKSPQDADAANLLVAHGEDLLLDLVNRMLETCPPRFEGDRQGILGPSAGPLRVPVDPLAYALVNLQPRLPDRDFLNTLYILPVSGLDREKFRFVVRSLDTAALRGVDELEAWIVENREELFQMLNSSGPGIRDLLEHLYSRSRPRA